MFGGRFSSSIGTVGIEIGSRSIRMLQVRRQGGRLHVVGAGEELLDTRGAAIAEEGGDHSGARNLAERLRAACAAGGFAGRRCVVSLPRADVCIQSVRLPKMPDGELEQAAAWEASQRFGFDRAAMEVSVLRTGATLQSGENREEVLLVAASHAVIHQRLEPILEAGLRPSAIDTGFGALARLFSQQFRRESDRQHVRAVLDVGGSGSTITILRGDQIAFCKPINIGGNMFDKAVSEHLQMDPVAAADLRVVRIVAEEAARIGRPSVHDRAGSDDGLNEFSGIDHATDRAVYEAVRPLIGDLTREVTLCLRYYGVTFRGKPPCQLILTGNDGLEPRLADMLSQACKIPVVLDDVPPAGSDAAAQQQEASLAGIGEGVRAMLNRECGPAAGWAVAAGLSIRGLSVARPPRAAEPAQTRGAAA